MANNDGSDGNSEKLFIRCSSSTYSGYSDSLLAGTLSRADDTTDDDEFSAPEPEIGDLAMNTLSLSPDIVVANYSNDKSDSEGSTPSASLSFKHYVMLQQSQTVDLRPKPVVVDPNVEDFSGKKYWESHKKRLVFTDPDSEETIGDVSQNKLNREYFISKLVSGKKCLLCECIAAKVVDHLLRHHESYTIFTSRVSMEMALHLRQNYEKFITIDDITSGRCCFCESYKSFKRDEWIKHLRKHTREDLYYCNGCDKPKKKISNHKNCSKDLVKPIFKDDVRDLMGYICSICNHVSIHEERMIDHVSYHQIENPNLALYKSVILVERTPWSELGAARAELAAQNAAQIAALNDAQNADQIAVLNYAQNR